jgi:hypothetical protein
MTHQADLTDVAQIARLVDATIERFGTWDILVNTAGLIVGKPLVQAAEEEYDESFAINAKIPYFFMREAYNKMAANGRIINLVTTQVAVTAATYSAYAGSKAPVEHFSKAFAKEIGPRGVTVNCIAPGPQKTSFFLARWTKRTSRRPHRGRELGRAVVAARGRAGGAGVLVAVHHARGLAAARLVRASVAGVGGLRAVRGVVAGVAEAVAVQVCLFGVGRRRAVVGVIADPV